MTPDQLRAIAQSASIRKGLAVRLTRAGDEPSTQYFQHRAAYESFVSRALHQGYTVEAIICGCS